MHSANGNLHTINIVDGAWLQNRAEITGTPTKSAQEFTTMVELVFFPLLWGGGNRPHPPPRGSTLGWTRSTYCMVSD